MQLWYRHVYSRGRARILYGSIAVNVVREVSTWDNVSQEKDNILFPVIRNYYRRCEP